MTLTPQQISLILVAAAIPGLTLLYWHFFKLLAKVVVGIWKVWRAVLRKMPKEITDE